VADSLLSCAASIWAWARENDIPNWVVVAFTGIGWPIALFLWHRRTVNSVPGLEVHFAAGKITIGDKPYSAVDVQFTNHTGAVAYVSGARIRSCTRVFPVPVEAARDIAKGSYHLKFIRENGAFDLREVTLQTSASAKTCMPTTPELTGEFYTHSPSWVARLSRHQKYFVLEYTAMVGTTRYAVATVY
jgi:hypothetical protein